MKSYYSTALAVALLTPCVVTQPTLAAGRQWAPYPLGPTGAYPPAVDGCEAGSYIVGFRVKTGSWFDKIGPLCAVLDATGKSWSNTVVPAMRGGDGGGAPTEYKCNPNEVVGGADVWANSDATVVNNMHIFCTSLNDSEDRRTIRIGDVPDVGSHHIQTQNCDPHQRGIAIKVVYGKYVNAVGLWCAPLKAAAYSNCVINGVVRKDIPDADCEEAKTTGCVRRLLSKEQYDNCMKAQKPKSGCLIGGVVRKDIADEDCKEAQTTGCIRHLLSQVQYDNCLAAQKPANTPPPNPPAKKAKVVAANTVYKKAIDDQSAANKVCEVKSGDTADVLGTGPDKWVHLGNISGACAGKSGFAWNDGEIVLP